MNVFVGIVAIVILLVAYLYMRNRNTGENRRPEQSGSSAGESDTQYHAVSLRYSGSACQAAQEMAGRRFLSSAAPKIPLANCDAAECNCVFAHHKDRRVRDDRRSPYGQGFGNSPSGQYGAEQRSGADRRDEPDKDLI